MNPTTNTVTYTPNPDAIAGSDSFTFTVNDGTVDSQPATVSITLEVTPNQPPTAQPVSDTLVQGQSKDIVLKDQIQIPGMNWYSLLLMDHKMVN